ncbi:MAG TPA: WD40 repeat domain-containing serine/threonine protein kinase, partial [Candidatus Nitrosotalea sp.]|nr:WD40 repeat domain-containing serine/threonine protein kinase [Candidatus Nitrosotalea sp.]
MDRSGPIIPDYEMLRRIGRGSYGEVWIARSVTGLYRAVKVIYRAQFDDDRPYEREFAGIKRFEPISRSHDSQLDVLHVGRNDAGGYFYYVMELADHVDGEVAFPVLNPQEYCPKTLKKVLSERGRLTVGESLPLAIALTDALAHLHSHGLVHRDIKPSNIIFVNGRPKLADIGLIATSDSACSFVGTEGFVPREGPGTPQADIYALGKVLYEIWTGRDRLEFPSLPENLESLPDRAGLREVNEVLLKASDPDPALRYSLASDLKNDLELILARKSVRRLRSLERKVRRGRKQAIAISVAAAVIGFGWYQSHRFNRMAASELAHVYVKNGQERFEQNDWLGALPWFAKALDLERSVPEREQAHRLRIANTIEWCPTLVALYSHFEAARYAFFDGGADRVLLCYTGDAAQVWESATDQPVTPKLHHEGQPFFGAFSRDGTRVATLSRGDGAARLWDARTGALVGHPILHGGQVRSLVFSPDDAWLATAGEDGAAQLWRTSDGADTGRRFVLGPTITLLAFSADGRQLLTAGGTNALAQVWDTATGEPLGSSLELSNQVSAAQFSPDGAEIAIGLASGGIAIWNPALKSIRHLTPTPHHAVFRLAFSPDGSRILVATEWSASLWNVRTGELLGPPIPAASMLRCAEFNPDGSRFLLAGESRTALIYDGFTARPVT